MTIQRTFCVLGFKSFFRFLFVFSDRYYRLSDWLVWLCIFTCVAGCAEHVFSGAYVEQLPPVDKWRPVSWRMNGRSTEQGRRLTSRIQEPGSILAGWWTEFSDRESSFPPKYLTFIIPRQQDIRQALPGVRSGLSSNIKRRYAVVRTWPFGRQMGQEIGFSV